jgi:plastocyanin
MKRASLLAATAVALLAAGGSAGASPKRVSITDNALTPVAAVIAIDDSVRWTNNGSQQHRVRALGTFSPFTLQREKRP